MFDTLQNSLDKIFKNLTGKGSISTSDIDASMREIRIALFEADVALPVVKNFINKIKEKALGVEVVKSITPGQMIVKIVQDEIEQLLTAESEDASNLNFQSSPPVTFLMVGLQGSGKTTTTAKIANFVKKESNKKILVASLDAYRPAAKEQLAQIAKKCEIDSLEIIQSEKPIETAKRAKEFAIKGMYDLLILDSAGRLHVDDEMMLELVEVEKISTPKEILLTADSLTGQDAVNVAKHFSEKLGVTGIILTRIDGDGRGGAALSMKSVINKPIKFICSGEKIEDIQKFDAKRIAQRILGMGDVVSLVEKAAELINEKDAERMERRMRQGKFDLNDMQSQFRSMNKIGGFSGIMNLLPGMGQIKNKIAEAKESGTFNENILSKYDAIISSMTKKEKRIPKLLNASRKKRIASGSGTSVQEINQLLKQHKQMQKVMKKFSGIDPSSMMKGGMSGLKNLFN